MDSMAVQDTRLQLHDIPVMNFGKYMIDKMAAYKHAEAMVCTLSHKIGGNRKRSKQSLKSGSKIARNSVFDCHLSPFGRHMAIKNSIF